MSSLTTAQVTSSVPTLAVFDPTRVPFQFDVLEWLRHQKYQFEGVKICLLSGSVGSAKSILAAHIIVTHALLFPGSGILVLRRSLKDLKRTVWPLILRHYPELRKYWNKSEMTISLPNGSMIYGDSYHDGDYDKFRSYELSMAVLEEATEAWEKDLFDQIMERIGRLPHIQENIFLLVTNPDSPEHWIYKEIIEKQNEFTKVFYSRTEDNPFLKPWYIENLKKTLDPKRALRMLYGQWVEINSEVIYHCYDKKLNALIAEEDQVDTDYPIDLMFDFNIGKGKPNSMAVGQYINGHFKILDEVILEGGNTPAVMEELASKGYFDDYDYFRIYGDCNGDNSDTRSPRSDYDIIKKFIAHYPRRDDQQPIRVEMKVSKTNPSVRYRHNTVNALFCNMNQERSIFVSSNCKTVDEGFRLTSLKKGGSYIEDDSKKFQHVTTAVGYWICRIVKESNIKEATVRKRA